MFIGWTASHDLQTLWLSFRELLEKAEANDKLPAITTLQA